jgi:hypothetical protein
MHLGARANITYRLDVVGRKAEFITLKHDEAVLDAKFQRRRDVIGICVVVCILYKLEQEVRFFVVQVARKSLKRALEFAAEPDDSGGGRRVGVGVVVAVLFPNDADESCGVVTLDGTNRHDGGELQANMDNTATTTTTTRDAFTCYACVESCPSSA